MAVKQRLGTGRSGEYAQKNGQTPSSGNAIVNKTYIDSLLSGGVSLAESLLLKSFFSHNSFLPANTFKEQLKSYPTPDYQNLNGGSLTKSMSREDIVLSGNPGNFGWDLLAAKSTILAICSGRPKQTGFGWALSSTLPSAGEVPNNSYLVAIYHTLVGIYKVTAGPTYTLLQSVTTVLNGDSYACPSFAQALYYDDATNRLILFLRIGPEQWWPALDLTDSSFTTFRYVSFRFSGSGVTMRSMCPLAIYHS